MSSEPATLPNSERAAAPPAVRPRRAAYRSRSHLATLSAHGEPMVWLTGGALVVALIMIIVLLAKVVQEGIDTFWPVPIVEVRLHDGRMLMGEVARNDRYQPGEQVFAEFNPEVAGIARAVVDADDGWADRRSIRTGNFELTNNHYTWVDSFLVAEESQPEWALVLERQEWGRFYGRPAAFLIDGAETAAGESATWEQFSEHHPAARERWEQRVQIEKHDLGAVRRRSKAAQLAVVEAELESGVGSPEHQAAESELERVKQQAAEENTEIMARIKALDDENARYQMRLTAADGGTQTISLAGIVRAVPANQLDLGDKFQVYLSRWREFLLDDPRESNSEGGVFPAIWGTVAMTLIMSLFVAPFGVLAALYLREYAKSGPLVSGIRIAINNLAGVPSIVFGVFGFGFLCYGVGKFVDGGPVHPWPRPIWFAALAALAACGTCAFVIGLAGWFRPMRETPSLARRLARRAALVLWLVCAALIVLLIAKTPFFHGFFRASLAENDPTFGTGGLLWASITLALLTLPVVIVATEEALAAVPNSMREGSYACGGSKWQTIRRIVLPRALPGIMTGMILAMARGAGEVAPLMLVGVMKLAPELPVDGVAPFVHPERSFMHLGFHIFDVSMQSQNSEAAKPMVFTTTLLLISIIAALNLAAVWLRTRLRGRFVSTQF